MKKSLLFILVLAAILLWQTAKADNLFSKNLYFGIQKDSDVIKLQEFLTSEGVYSGPITGNFFSLTLKAVKDYQTREGISPAAGYFGPLTKAKVNAKLSIQLQESENQAVAETGSTTAPVVQPKTTNDIANTVQSQLDALLQQVALLQQQLQTQQQTQQSVQNLQTQVTQQTQTIQQQQQTQQQIQIVSVDATSTITSAKIEWQTDLPTNSKIFISGGTLSSKVFNSESGLSTRHIVNINSLTSNTTYSYEIEAIVNNVFTKKTGGFQTQTPPPIPEDALACKYNRLLPEEYRAQLPSPDISNMNSVAQCYWWMHTKYGDKYPYSQSGQAGY